MPEIKLTLVRVNPVINTPFRVLTLLVFIVIAVVIAINAD